MISTIFKRTKILATVGPAVHSPEKIKELMKLGVNGFRINFSHGAEPDRLEQISWIRQASKEFDKPVAILQDLQGPKIRLGDLVDNMLEVKIGDMLILDSSIAEHDGGKSLPVQYNLAEKMKVGELLYMFDGKVRSTVREIVSPTAIRVEVENNGYLRSRKGLNLPDTNFGGDIMTPKDIADMEWGVDKDFDYLALSFIQTAEDVHSLRQRLVALGSTVDIISKIETKSAISEENLEDIIMASDGVMVARGDLAVEAGAEVVPVVQRRIVALCRKHGKLVIVATQMMGSMMENPEPSRAEVGDVATAVYQGADVVMLSDETAMGKYPLEAVQAMRKTIIYTQDHSEVMAVESSEARKKTSAILSYTAAQLAKEVKAKAIIVETTSGSTAVSVGAFRPNMPIISITDSESTACKLALNYATSPVVKQITGFGVARSFAEALHADGYFGEGSATVVLVSGHEPGHSGKTDNIQVMTLG